MKSFLLPLFSLVLATSISALDPVIEKKVSDLLSQMTLEEKVGQMTQAARDYLKPGDIKSLFLGSVLSGGGSVPWDNSPAGWRKMVQGYQDEALQTRLKIPLLYGIDAVHGHGNLLGATIFPHNIGLGATRDADLVYRVERATAEELKATGIPWSFAPCVAVVQDLRWGRTYEGFSSDPELAATLALAAVRGFQGEKLGETGVGATVKHFAADGGTLSGVDRGDAVLTQTQLETIHLRPYAEALKANPAAIMASFSSINGLKMHANKDLLTGWLKQKEGFAGLLVSDWGAVKFLPGRPEEQVAAAINAGVDLVMVPDDYENFIRLLLSQVRSGAVPQTRIDDAVTRILRVKFALKLFASPLPSGSMNLEAHRVIAREAVQKSFTLLKNEGLLPLAKGKNLLVVGAKSDDVGAMCGGWTLTWQGSLGNRMPGTTLFNGLTSEFGEAHVRFSADGNSPAGFKPDVVVFVPGEKPYAEGPGDSKDLLPDYSDLRLFNGLKEGNLKNLPLLTLVVSGRPLVMNEILDRSQAFAALWLPGTEAGSVAQVLSGTVKPSGKLSQPWPKTADQTQVVYPRGFGLSY